MPIYDQSYRPYRGTFSSHSMRWWTIARTGVMHFLSKRVFIVLLTLTFIYPIAAGAQIWIVHQFPEQRFVTIDGEFFRRFLEIQTFWFLVLGIFPGTGLISNDLRWNAIQLYLSKPLTRLDYVTGKFAIMATFMLGVTLVPGLLLYILQLGFSSDTKFLFAYWWIPFSLAAYAALGTLVWGLVVLALSSLSKSSRYVGILLLSLIFFTSGFALFLRGVFNAEGMIVLSVFDDLKLLTYLFFGGESEYGNHVFGAAVMLAFLAAGSALILRARVRAVEVVT